MAHTGCMLNMQGYASLRACTRPSDRAPTRPGTHTHARARSHTYTHHTDKYVIFIAFLRQTRLNFTLYVHCLLCFTYSCLNMITSCLILVAAMSYNLRVLKFISDRYLMENKSSVMSKVQGLLKPLLKFELIKN